MATDLRFVRWKRVSQRVNTIRNIGMQQKAKVKRSTGHGNVKGVDITTLSDIADATTVDWTNAIGSGWMPTTRGNDDAIGSGWMRGNDARMDVLSGNVCVCV